ncbi:MAG: hypothetical protein ACRD29_01860 [Acidimicrobiales bacterium]
MATRAEDGLGGPPEEAVRLNELLLAAGFTDEAVTLWWNQLAHVELDGRTAHQAWVAGEHERVSDLVKAKVAYGTAEREWVARLRAEAVAGGLKGRLAAQASPRAVVEQWRAGRSA